MTTNHRTLMLLAIAVSALLGMAGLSGCGGGGGSDSPTYATTHYFPLVQSNWWSYNVTQYDLGVTSASVSSACLWHPFAGREVLTLPTIGTASSGAEVGVGVLLLQVSGTMNVDGETWYELTSTLQNSAEPPTISYFRHDANGMQTHVEPNGGDPYSYYRIKTPLVLNNTWYPFEGFDDVSHIGGVNLTITVPAGTFYGCLLVIEEWQDNGHAYRVETWWAEDVGLVRSDDYTDNVLAGTTELAAYSTISE